MTGSFDDRVRACGHPRPLQVLHCAPLCQIAGGLAQPLDLQTITTEPHLRAEPVFTQNESRKKTNPGPTIAESTAALDIKI